MLDKIKKEFGNKILDIYFEKEMNLTFLRIKINVTNLDDVTELSKAISNFIDKVDKSDQQYYLDIFSKGAEVSIDINNLNEYINKNILIKLKKSIKNKQEFEGLLLNNDISSIIVEWNAKGQFRKQVINKDNIEEIKLSIKIKKEKNNE